VSGISGNYEDGRAAPNASLNHDVTDPFCWLFVLQATYELNALQWQGYLITFMELVSLR
jgi:hypothetical protein